MNLLRLALPAAALAAVVSVNLARAEENPVRQFLNDEFKSAPAAEENTPTIAPALAPAGDNSQINTFIEKHAAANGIPAAFVRAIVRIESNYNPRATGRQREVGLMQIKFETARGIGFTGTREELYNPDTNLQWGTKYLAMSWKLGGNTPCGAVMKYQGGHAVTRMSAASNAYCAKVKAHMASN
jgi:soluble lytic murein transglycosylase-like protein